MSNNSSVFQPFKKVTPNRQVVSPRRVNKTRLGMTNSKVTK
jgi:hypothetical protein